MRVICQMTNFIAALGLTGLPCVACSVRDWSGRKANPAACGRVVGESRSRVKPDLLFLCFEKPRPAVKQNKISSTCCECERGGHAQR